MVSEELLAPLVGGAIVLVAGLIAWLSWGRFLKGRKSGPIGGENEYAGAGVEFVAAVLLIGLGALIIVLF